MFLSTIDAILPLLFFQYKVKLLITGAYYGINLLTKGGYSGGGWQGPLLC